MFRNINLIIIAIYFNKQTYDLILNYIRFYKIVEKIGEKNNDKLLQFII